MAGQHRHPATLDEAALLAQCKARRQRRSGPGGQHRNKVETAVVFEHLPTGTLGEASERRSQEQNRRMAVFRLRVRLAIEHRTPVDFDTELPSELWHSRCVSRRIAINPSHADFPSLLAEALDVLAAADWNPQHAASFLGCSTSQLVKLIQLEPQAFQMLNRQRDDRGLRPLR